MTILKRENYTLNNSLQFNNFSKLIEDCILISNSSLKISFFQEKIMSIRKFNGSFEISHLSFYFSDLSNEPSLLENIDSSEKLNIFSDNYSFSISKHEYSYHIVYADHLDIFLINESKHTIYF